MYAFFLNIILRKIVNWERKSKFKIPLTTTFVYLSYVWLECKASMMCSRSCLDVLTVYQTTHLFINKNGCGPLTYQATFLDSSGL